MAKFVTYRDSFRNARLTRSETGVLEVVLHMDGDTLVFNGHRHEQFNEIVPANELLARAREIAQGLAALPPLATRYTRIALTQKLRRIIDEGVGYGLALEGISAADLALSMRTNGGSFIRESYLVGRDFESRLPDPITSVTPRRISWSCTAIFGRISTRFVARAATAFSPIWSDRPRARLMPAGIMATPAARSSSGAPMITSGWGAIPPS